MRKKRYIILSPAHPLRGGIASSSERLAQEIQDEGHEVEMISFSLQYPEFLFPGKTQYTTDDAPKGLRIQPLINSINPRSWNKTARYIIEQQPYMIIVRYFIPFLGPSLGFICRKVRKHCPETKIFALADNIIPHEARPLDRAFTSYFVKSVQGFVVMSKSVGVDLQKFSTSLDCQFAPHPIYDNYGEAIDRAVAIRELGLDPSLRYVLFFGFIREYKGLDILLNALSDNRLAQRNVHLIVAGEFYSNEKKYTQLIEQLDIKNRVHLFSEYISNDKVRYFFGASDLVVQPYRSATQSGISQLAYHFDKPMIVTRVGGLPEIVEDQVCGYVVDVDANRVADAMVDYYDQERMEAMTKSVSEAKQRFSWKALLGAFHRLEARKP